MGSPHKQEFPPLLPVGFHPMTLAEMRTALVDKIAGSRRRRPVMDGLQKIIEKLVADGIEAEVWVDGSFVTKKIDPDDSDILVLISSDFYAKATPAQKTTIDWLNSDLKTGFLCHSHVLYQYPAGHAEHTVGVWMHGYWLRQFGFTRKDEAKGIALIKTP
jgi:hypothetical protein